MTLAPRSAQQARLFRLANRLARDKVPGAPTAEADKLLWAKAHERKLADERLSRDEEALKRRALPTAVGAHAPANHQTTSGDNLFHFREYPMYPGEYVPPQHNTLSSLRDELAADLSAQSLKTAWLKVSKNGSTFDTPEDYYSRVDGLEESQLSEIVHALFPSLNAAEAASLVRRTLETISKPSDNASRQLAESVSAEALGLDNAPGHYTNFLQWFGRITTSKAFQTENSIDQLCRRAFNKGDVRVMYENYNLLSPEALNRMKADGYSHYYTVLRDYATKVAGRDTRHQIGVRIDPPEIDPETGFSFGVGSTFQIEMRCYLRQNTDATGEVCIQGKPWHVFFEDRSVDMETILSVFDEAGLNARDFDVYFYIASAMHENINRGYALSTASSLALANAVSRMLPLTRIPLKKAGLLSMDRRKADEPHSGFLNGKERRRHFSKRA